MSNDWKTGEGSWVTTPDGVTISQHMIAMAVEFVNRHTDAMPPMLVHEIKKHLAAQAQMVTRICEMSARPTPENGLREALERKAKYLRPGDVNFAMAHVIEECGEVCAAIGKSQRWGLDSFNPELPPEQRETNAAWVKREIDDLRGALDRLEAEFSDAC